MKKRYLAVPLVIGVASASWAGTTLYGGSEARVAYEALLKDIGSTTGLSLVQASYESGFLHSEAVTELRAGADADAEVLMRFRHVIEHSPVGNAGLRAARIVTTADTGRLDSAAAAKLATLFDGAAPLTIDSVIGLGGNAEHTITIAAWQHDSGPGPVSSDAMTWTVQQGSDGRLSGTGVWPGLRFSSNDGAGFELTLGASHDRFDYQKVATGLYVGNYSAELGDLSAGASGTGLSGSLSGMRLSSSTEIVDDAYRGEGTFQIGAMNLPVELDSLRLHTAFDGIPVAGFALARAAAAELNAATLTEDEAVIELATRNYLETLATFVRPGLSVDYGAKLTNSGGEASASWNLAFVGDGSASGHDDIETLGELIGVLTSSVAVEVDAMALAMTPAEMFFDPSGMAPWIVADADGYRAAIRLENGVLDVNGQPMPIAAMAGDAMSMSLRGLLDDAI